MPVSFQTRTFCQISPAARTSAPAPRPALLREFLEVTPFRFFLSRAFFKKPLKNHGFFSRNFPRFSARQKIPGFYSRKNPRRLRAVEMVIYPLVYSLRSVRVTFRSSVNQLPCRTLLRTIEIYIFSFFLSRALNLFFKKNSAAH
jgi:hypothetical protein